MKDSRHQGAAPLQSVPLVDLQKQLAAIGDSLERRFQALMARGDFVLGEDVRKLETELATFAGCGQVVSVASGTDSLKIPLMAEDIGPGDAVFVPAFTFAATAEVVMQVGASPVFVDVDPDYLNMDCDDLEAKIAEVKHAGRLKPRAIIPVDLFGSPADYDRILPIAEQGGLFVLADSAQSFGATQGGVRVGGLAPVTSTSFYPSKPLGCFGDGGAIFTDDGARAEIYRTIRGHGFDSGGEVRRVGMNSRLDSLQAAVLLTKLEVFEAELGARARAAGWYEARLSGHVRTPRVPQKNASAWAVYSVRTPRREDVVRKLKEDGIANAVYYRKALHLHETFAPFAGGPGSLAVSEQVSGEVVALPMHGYLDEETVDRICASVVSAL